MDLFEITARGERIIKPDLELEMEEIAGSSLKAVKIISTALGLDWNKKEKKLREKAPYTDEEAQYLEELVALAEKVQQVKRWREGIEEEYDDLESEEVLGGKLKLNEREEEYLEVKEQLRGEEMTAIIDFYELMVDFMHMQREKLK